MGRRRKQPVRRSRPSDVLGWSVFAAGLALGTALWCDATTTEAALMSGSALGAGVVLWMLDPRSSGRR